MKYLVDGTKVSDRSYYFLLDWNDENRRKFIIEQFGKETLSELNRAEYKRLLNKASLDEMNKL